MAQQRWLFIATCVMAVVVTRTSAFGSWTKTPLPAETRSGLNYADSGRLGSLYSNTGQNSYNYGYSNANYTYTTGFYYTKEAFKPKPYAPRTPTIPPVVQVPPFFVEDSRTDDFCPIDVNCTCLQSIYRSYDGSCNNVDHGSWGMAGAPFMRLTTPRYEANGDILYKGIGGYIPNARVVSETISKDDYKVNYINTMAVMQWGQIVAHDTGHIMPITDNNGVLQCCTVDNQPLTTPPVGCAAINVPKDDPYYAYYYVRCLNFVRGQTVANCTNSTESEYQWQINGVSSSPDGSFIYGNSVAENLALRTLSGGLLRTQSLKSYYGLSSRSFPPTDPSGECSMDYESKDCFLTGDSRQNICPYLPAWNTLFLRLHNIIAKALHDQHPGYNDETLFQEARRIVIAIYQHITYNYYLPRVLGPTATEALGLTISKTGNSTNYNSSINHSTLSEFSNAAYRYLHSTVPPTIDFDGEGRCPFRRIYLSEWFNKPGIIVNGDNLDSMIRGACTQPEMETAQSTTKELTKFLFRDYRKGYGSDLISIDIQRGRDAGLVTYNDMREKCGLPKANGWMDLYDVMTYESIAKLKELYSSPHDIDLEVGLYMEDNKFMGDPYATVGPVAGCIIAEQFYRWRYGDQFFYDSVGGVYPFTTAQLNAIKAIDLSTIICLTSDYIRFIQSDCFRQIYPGNELLDCKQVPALDLAPWDSYVIANVTLPASCP